MRVLFRSSVASNPSVVMPMASMSTRLVLHRLYRYVATATVGTAINVDRAMRALVRPTLRPSAIRLDGSHSSTPKLTKPQASAASVSATLKPKQRARFSRSPA